MRLAAPPAPASRDEPAAATGSDATVSGSCDCEVEAVSALAVHSFALTGSGKLWLLTSALPLLATGDGKGLDAAIGTGKGTGDDTA